MIGGIETDYLRVFFKLNGKKMHCDFWNIEGATPLDHIWMYGGDKLAMVKESDIIGAEKFTK